MQVIHKIQIYDHEAVNHNVQMTKIAISIGHFRCMQILFMLVFYVDANLLYTVKH